MKYKGYYGSIEFDEDDEILYGKLQFVKALISYEAEDAHGIKKAFQEAVEDYLNLCEAEGIAPEKPFSGTFNIRSTPETHKRLAMYANSNKMSMNTYICRALDYYLDREERRNKPGSASLDNHSHL